MARNFRFELRTASGIILPMRVEFPDPEWERVEEYLGYVKELTRLPLVRSGFWPAARLLAGTSTNPGKVTSLVQRDGETFISIEGGGPLDADPSHFPNREELDSFMYRMRRFILKNAEPNTYFLTILKMFSRKIHLPGWQKLKDRFTGKYSLRHMKLEVTKGGKLQELISDVSLNQWLNAFEQHHDPKVAAEFKEIPAEHITPTAIRAVMLELVAEQAIAIVLLGKIIDTFKSGGGALSFEPDS